MRRFQRWSATSAREPGSAAWRCLFARLGAFRDLLIVPGDIEHRPLRRLVGHAFAEATRLFGAIPPMLRRPESDRHAPRPDASTEHIETSADCQSVIGPSCRDSSAWMIRLGSIVPWGRGTFLHGC